LPFSGFDSRRLHQISPAAKFGVLSLSKGTKKLSNTYHFYILKCADDSYYAGITGNIESRLIAHNSGKASPYTSIRRPVQLVYHERFGDFESAVRRERQVKKWSRAKKEALINNDLETLKELSKGS
jgi:putative endonuclease